MYLKVTLTLLFLLAGAIAVRIWRPPVSNSAAASVIGGIKPYGVWPRDTAGVDPILNKRIGRVVIDAERLDVALVQFRQQAGVNLVWHTDDVRVKSGEPIRKEFRDTTVVAALTELMSLAKYPTPIGTRDGIVVIGSFAVVIRFYDVRSLLSNVPAPPPPATQSSGAVFGQTNDEAEGAAALMEIIREQVPDLNWETYARRDSMEYWDGILIIKDRPEVHRRVIQLLETLRSKGPAAR